MQIRRMTQLSYKSALFLMHRIRFAMTGPENQEPLNGTVEVDETYVGGKPRYRGQGIYGRGTRKQPVMALVQRNGEVRTRVIADVTAHTLKSAIREQVSKNSRIMTDEWKSYRGIGKDFDGGHQTVNHGAREYARGDTYTNTAESFFALLKRGVYGTFHSVSKKHLHRYMAEFGFRWNTRNMNDGARVMRAIRSSEGKRLMYREPKVA